MTLIPYTNKKEDTRMVDYNQAVVKLGLVKAALEGDVEKKRREFSNLQTSVNLMRTMFLRNSDKFTEKQKAQVEGKLKTLSSFEEHIASKQKDLDLITTKLEEVGENVSVEESILFNLTTSIETEEKNKKNLVDEIQKLADSHIEKQRATSIAITAYDKAKNDLDLALAKVRDVGDNKISLDDLVVKATKELEELNEIISVLQLSNKTGLDAIASLEGERQRIRDKEDLLLRKEADLKVYENRVEKKAKVVGIDLKMKFK